MDNNLEVAKAMIQAGIQAAAHLAELAGSDAEAKDADRTVGRTLH